MEKKDFWKTEPRYIIQWRNIWTKKFTTKKRYTWKKAIELALDAKYGTLIDKAVTDKVSIIDTKTGLETIV